MVLALLAGLRPSAASRRMSQQPARERWAPSTGAGPDRRDCAAGPEGDWEPGVLAVDDGVSLHEKNCSPWPRRPRHALGQPAPGRSRSSPSRRPRRSSLLDTRADLRPRRRHRGPGAPLLRGDGPSCRPPFTSRRAALRLALAPGLATVACGLFGRRRYALKGVVQEVRPNDEAVVAHEDRCSRPCGPA